MTGAPHLVSKPTTEPSAAANEPTGLIKTLREWGLSSRARPKAPKGEQPKKPAAKKIPKSLQEVNALLRKLGDYPKAEGPYAADDYDALTRRRLDWTEQRRRLLGLQRELSKRTDNDAIASKDTVEVSVDDPEDVKKARKNTMRVKRSEAWRHNHMTGLQRQAESEMELAWRARTAGLGATSASYGSARGGASIGNMNAAMDRTWRDWSGAARVRGVHVDAFIEVLAEPKTLADIERERRLKPGQAFANYEAGLDLWCELRGWSRSRD